MCWYTAVRLKQGQGQGQGQGMSEDAEKTMLWPESGKVNLIFQRSSSRQ
jgi:hypothetical protein